MSRDYDEKRDFFRMTADCPLSFSIHGSEANNSGQCINLSAGGIRFRSAVKLEQTTLIDIHITPEKSVVPPLKAVIEITRREPSSEDGQYEYAGSIKQLL
ncbi:MAG: PilZ domain-containing protein [Gammaproteobacteria bacterium]|nr:PilZ domain-containing protein [Gammaproteobacteria bacterium]MCF6229991.1 PilZ domain-containing protein [Gammaproteobacteria bacterium]